ncbi:MAG: hypothetical protein R3A10_11885 [Caldilineaceae bacterium]
MVVFWRSAAPGVFAAGCDEPGLASVAASSCLRPRRRLSLRLRLHGLHVTGGWAIGWRPGASVHHRGASTTGDTDWAQNLAGVHALLAELAQ